MPGARKKRSMLSEKEKTSTSKLHENTEAVIDLHIMIREKICRELCPGGKYCRDMVCLEAFFRVAGRIELKMEELNAGKN